MGLVRFAIKSTIAGGAVYYTINEGLWADPDKSINSYQQFNNSIAGYVKDILPKDVIAMVPEMQMPGDISFTLVKYWNTGVITSTEFLSNIPTHLSNAMNNVSSTIKKQLEQQS